MDSLKQALQIVGLGTILALLAPLAVAQETHVSREGGAWGQEITGSLAAGTSASKPGRDSDLLTNGLYLLSSVLSASALLNYLPRSG